MRSIRFTPGAAFLSSHSTISPWYVAFEDEGATGYFYACDRSLQADDAAEDSGTVDDGAILDSMLIYNVGSLEDRERERLLSVDWSRDGLQAVLYMDGTPQALVNFTARQSFCRSNFPNFIEAQGDTWRKASHAWSDEAMERFDAALYA